MGDGQNGAAPQVPIDVHSIDEVGDSMYEVLHSYMTSRSSAVYAAIALNEKACAFYERMIIADSAILALSLSFVNTLISRSSAAHIPKHLFYSLVCAAWGLLLVAIFLGLHCIAHFHRVNAGLLVWARSLSDEYHTHHLGMLMQRLAWTMTPVAAEEVRKQISSNGTEAMASATEIRSGGDAKLNDLVGESRKYNRLSRLLMLCTVVAVILLCIFAVKSLPLS
jgi:hypothetical protein